MKRQATDISRKYETKKKKKKKTTSIIRKQTTELETKEPVPSRNGTTMKDKKKWLRSCSQLKENRDNSIQCVISSRFWEQLSRTILGQLVKFEYGSQILT
jgi:hypothetical protein